jgi:sec-independent protein translocase protein TatA
MGLSWSHILIVLVLFVLLFGRGKISELMGDVAQGIKSFKKGISEDEEEAPSRPAPKAIEHKPQRAKTASRAKTSGTKSARSRKTS